jgi:hypothetical protein
MLCKHDPKERPDTLGAVMDHPYFKGDDALSKNTDSVTAECLQALLKE